MSIRTIVYSAAGAMMLGRVAKRLVYAAVALLARPLDVASVHSRIGEPTVAASFCDRNPHTCRSAGELYKELQLRSLAVRDLMGGLAS